MSNVWSQLIVWNLHSRTNWHIFWVIQSTNTIRTIRWGFHPKVQWSLHYLSSFQFKDIVDELIHNLQVHNYPQIIKGPSKPSGYGSSSTVSPPTPFSSYYPIGMQINWASSVQKFYNSSRYKSRNKNNNSKIKRDIRFLSSARMLWFWKPEIKICLNAIEMKEIMVS